MITGMLAVSGLALSAATTSRPLGSPGASLWSTRTTSACICLARATASEPLLTAVTFASSAAKVILMAKRIVLESSIARILVGM